MGYPVEVHQITTSDGYKISLHRIPHSPFSQQGQSRPPLLLVHGLTVSGSMYIVPLTDIKKGLAYMLSDAGYDIWIFHARGTHMSMKHTTLTPTDKKYWDFSWHEIGLYDVTSTIDYILKYTGAEKIHYSGVSQGTTVFLVALSMRPEYNKKVASAYLMVPVGSLAHISGLAKYLIESQIAQFIVETFNKAEIYFLPLKNEFLQQIMNTFCRDTVRFLLCQEFTEFGIGRLNYSLNLYDLLLLMLNNIIDNASAKQFQHYVQISQSKKFQQFDYGSAGNKKRYKSRTPPKYNLSRIEVPVTLMSAKYDSLATDEVIK